MTVTGVQTCALPISLHVIVWTLRIIVARDRWMHSRVAVTFTILNLTNAVGQFAEKDRWHSITKPEELPSATGDARSNSIVGFSKPEVVRHRSKWFATSCHSRLRSSSHVSNRDWRSDV